MIDGIVEQIRLEVANMASDSLGAVEQQLLRVNDALRLLHESYLRGEITQQQFVAGIRGLNAEGDKLVRTYERIDATQRQAAAGVVAHANAQNAWIAVVKHANEVGAEMSARLQKEHEEESRRYAEQLKMMAGRAAEERRAAAESRAAADDRAVAIVREAKARAEASRDAEFAADRMAAAEALRAAQAEHAFEAERKEIDATLRAAEADLKAAAAGDKAVKVKEQEDGINAALARSNEDLARSYEREAEALEKFAADMARAGAMAGESPERQVRWRQELARATEEEAQAVVGLAAAKARFAEAERAAEEAEAHHRLEVANMASEPPGLGESSYYRESVQKKVEAAVELTRATRELAEAEGREVAAGAQIQAVADQARQAYEALAKAAKEAARTYGANSQQATQAAYQAQQARDTADAAAAAAGRAAQQMGKFHQTITNPAVPRALMFTAQGLEDLQYGVNAVVNNIPLITQAWGEVLGLGPKTSMMLGGLASISATALNQMVQHWGGLRDAISSMVRGDGEGSVGTAISRWLAGIGDQFAVTMKVKVPESIDRTKQELQSAEKVTKDFGDRTRLTLAEMGDYDKAREKVKKLRDQLKDLKDLQDLMDGKSKEQSKYSSAFDEAFRETGGADAMDTLRQALAASADAKGRVLLRETGEVGTADEIAKKMTLLASRGNKYVFKEIFDRLNETNARPTKFQMELARVNPAFEQTKEDQDELRRQKRVFDDNQKAAREANRVKDHAAEEQRKLLRGDKQWFDREVSQVISAFRKPIEGEADEKIARMLVAGQDDATIRSVIKQFVQEKLKNQGIDPFLMEGPEGAVAKLEDSLDVRFRGKLGGRQGLVGRRQAGQEWLDEALEKKAQDEKRDAEKKDREARKGDREANAASAARQFQQMGVPANLATGYGKKAADAVAGGRAENLEAAVGAIVEQQQQRWFKAMNRQQIQAYRQQAAEFFAQQGAVEPYKFADQLINLEKNGMSERMAMARVMQQVLRQLQQMGMMHNQFMGNMNQMEAQFSALNQGFGRG